MVARWAAGQCQGAGMADYGALEMGEVFGILGYQEEYPFIWLPSLSRFSNEPPLVVSIQAPLDKLK